MDSIKDVAATKLCNTCGACAAVCPIDAIEYNETVAGYCLPVVDESLCNGCGLCKSVCPGIHFGPTLCSKMPDDPFVGNALTASVGKATNEKIFANSQSGGVVTAILESAIKTGIIKSAITVKMQPGNPPRPVVHICKTIEELYESQKSKYCPVPVLTFLKQLKAEDGPVAVVGTSCHIHGLTNIIDKFPHIKTKIAFTIGLLCDRVLTLAAIDFLRNRSGMGNMASSIDFRNKLVSGYPGDVLLTLSNGNKAVIKSTERIKIKDYFTPVRCRLCFDKMNVYSDISVGDPHGLKNIDRKLGESMIIARTAFGKDIIESAVKSKAVVLRDVNYNDVVKGQGIVKKKQQWSGYIEAWAKMGNQLPDFANPVKTRITVKPDQISHYKSSLQHSLNIDNYENRNELVLLVEKTLNRKQLQAYLLAPFTLAKKTFKYILKKLHRSRKD